MFAVSATQSSVVSAAALAVRARNARHSRRTAVRVTADAESDKPIVFTSEDLSGAAPTAAEQTISASTPAAPAAFSAAIDPADGSVAEAAPLGDDFSMLNAAMVAFKEPRAVEIINGRVAMIGWMAALFMEISKNESLTRQVLNTRTFTLADGVVKSSTMPAAGMFLIPVTVLFVLAASLAPQLRNREDNGLEVEPKDFAVFKASSEMTNGRGAMVGLVALLFAEKFTNGAALF